jgi:hypothetical protein
MPDNVREGETRFFIRPKTPLPPEDKRFWVGWDVGQSQDYSAIAILKKVPGSGYLVSYLDRLPLGTSYPDQVQHIRGLMGRKPLNQAQTTLCVDTTGVGKPVLDMAARKGLNPVGVQIHGGDTATWDESRTVARVPKKDLISTLVILAQSGHVRIAKGLQHGDLLAKELSDYQVRINPNTASVSFGNGREAEHDDLVLAVAVALWVGERRYPPAPATRQYVTVGRQRVPVF